MILKIALLSYEYPPDTGFGGIGSYTWHHARALAALGEEVHVLAGAVQGHALDTQDQDGVRVHRYRARDPLMWGCAALGRLGLPWTGNRLQNAWSMGRAFARLQSSHGFDVVEAPECGADAAWITAVGAVPSVVRLHSPARCIMPFYAVSALDLSGCAAIERQAIRRATALSACSRFVAQAAAPELGLGQQASIIRNGLDLEWFDQAASARVQAEDFGLPGDQPIVLFTGRLERRKGIHLCATIAASLLARHRVSLVFVGDDPEGIYRRAILPAVAGVDRLGSVHWLGRRDIAEIRSLVRLCRVFMLPSLWENCPYSCLEAMAAGRAVVCTDQGGLPEIVRDGDNGLLARSGDAAHFAALIAQLLDAPALAARLGENARATVRHHHSHLAVAREALNLYRSIARPCR